MSSSISRDRSSVPVSAEEQAPAGVGPRSTSTTNVLSTSGPGSAGFVEPAELAAGSQLGNYVILACIGRGAMASVYRAEHSLLNKQVALKVMAPALHASAEARQRFLREARAVAAIQHPNVVSISDAGLFEGTPYLVMELLDGEDLEQHLLQHGPFAASELPAIALPIVAALAAAHDAGVIHRDLKPGNIFLARGSSGELVPKLLDFGISKFASPAGPNLAVTAFDQLMGSPLYLPPEALQGSRELTPRSDQYSLGVLLYECITGRAPFYRDDLLPLLNAISEGRCPAPHELRPETPLALEQAILRAMSVEPLQRFAHIRELGQALLELADPHTRQRWSSSFAASGAMVVAAPPAAAVRAAPAPGVVVAPPDSARRNSTEHAAHRASQPLGKRRRLLGAWALLGSGCLLLALALGRTRSSAVPPVRAQLSALDALGTLSHGEGNVEVASARAPSAAAPAHGARGTWQRSSSPPAPGSSLPEGVSPPAPGPVVAAVGPAGAAQRARSRTSSPAPAAGAAARGHERRAVARRAAEPDDTGELRQLFFREAAVVSAPAASGERAPQTTSPVPVPRLVNEAPLFD